MAHKHATEMLQFAQDAAETDKPWERWEVRPAGDNPWQALESAPAWDVGQEYRRIAKRRSFGGLQWLAPLDEVPAHGTRYFAVNSTSADAVGLEYWRGDVVDTRMLARGLAFATEEAAREAWLAMQKIFGGAA